MKKVSKDNKKIYIFILIVILFLVVIFLILKNLKKGSQNATGVEYIDTLTFEEKSLIKGNDSNTENIILDEHGNKLNISQELNKERKLSESISIDNIFLMCSNGKSVFHANLNNETDSIISKFKVELKFLNKNNNTIYETIYDVPAITSHSRHILELIVDSDISNANSVIIEKK